MENVPVFTAADNSETEMQATPALTGDIGL
jgi:hypothetical protein